MSQPTSRRPRLRGALRRLLGAGALIATIGAFPTAALAQGGNPGGGGETSETVTNNLSFPALWSEGVPMTLNGTYGSPQFTNPTTVTQPDGSTLTLYLQGDPENIWQAENMAATAPVNVSQIDWGDNLESRTFSLNQKIRVETTLIEDLTTPMTGFTMYSAGGSKDTEKFGTDTTTYDSPQATIYSTCARLTIQRLDVSRTDPYLSRLTWDSSTGAWTGPGLVAPPILNSGIWNTAEGGGFAAEVNGSGKLDYGYNWNTSGLSAGDYRITFSLDPNCPVATLNTFITPLTTIYMTSETTGTSTAAATLAAAAEPTGAAAKLDPANNLSYIDVELGSPSYEPYVPPAPSNTALPTISGSPIQGQTLTASAGSWDFSPTSYAYQWLRCDVTGSACSNITGATGTSYRLTSADVGHTLRVVVKATNSDGSATARSDATRLVVPAAPVNSGAPRILGSAVKGQTLVATSGSWKNAPTSFTYHWQVCGLRATSCTDIAGAHAGSYRLGPAVVGHRLRVRVTATNDGGSTSATSRLTAKIAAKPSASVTLRLQFRSHDRLRLSGSVRPAHNGRHLMLQRRIHNRWRTVATAVLHRTQTGASTYAVVLAHRTPGLYRAYLGRDAKHRPSISHVRTVRRLAHVTMTLRHVNAEQVRVWGSITPARDGRRLRIQRQVRSIWQTVATVRLHHVAGNRSRYGITLTHAHNGLYRARFGGDAKLRPSSSVTAWLR